METKRGTPTAYDEWLAKCGLIEPHVETLVVGWENEEELLAAGMSPLHVLSTDVPQAWIGPSGGPAPRHIFEDRVVWRWT